MLRLIQIHRQFLLDDSALFVDVRRVKFGVEKHIREHVEQIVKTVMPRLGVVTSHFLAREGVQITSDALHVLRNPPGRTPLRALEQHVLDEMTDAVRLSRFVTSAHSDPQAEAHAGHVRHFRRGDGEAVFQMSDLIHRKARSGARAREMPA